MTTSAFWVLIRQTNRLLSTTSFVIHRCFGLTFAVKTCKRMLPF